MGERAFTHGPWFVTDDDSVGQAVVRNADIEVCTCWHHCVGSIEKEMRANARLIAAAPAMYEALKHAHDILLAAAERMRRLGQDESARGLEAEAADVSAALSQASEGNSKEGASRSQPSGVGPADLTDPQSQHSDGGR